MKYVVKKTAMYGSSTYGPYGSYQEALDASKELENNTVSESFFTVERVKEKNSPKYKVWIDDNFHFMVKMSAFSTVNSTLQRKQL